MQWDTPLPPAELAENRLVSAILDGTFPIDSNLPAERELASMVGVTRPTLREALQRLARDGWIEIHHGRPTRVRNYWEEGNLSILGSIASHQEHLPENFVANLLLVRVLMAPTYFRLAFEHSLPQVISLLQDLSNTPDTTEEMAAADWRLHYRMCILSGNPVFTLILNGFSSLYQNMALRYFEQPEARSHSHRFYHSLTTAASDGWPGAAEALVKQVMEESVKFWKNVDLSKEKKA
jgi:GntR family negative regulator for fad regulon and positive regulator of fabA